MAKNKPVIFCVDDDAEVLSSIERDLRQHYTNEYRIMKAGSAQEASDACMQLKHRGNAVALFLVDQRMPEISGTEFLAEIRKIFPESRKVLLTAYADTEAAIVSINEIGLDHYLMKPWDPPEQKLYPILDDVLALWSSQVKTDFEGIRIAGANWNARSYETKEFLSQNRVPYLWIDIERDEAVKELIRPLSDEFKNLPVILMPDGTYLTAPSNLELASKTGIQTKANKPFYDLVVIGSGPAGLANAVYGASEGLRTLIIERNAPGGQAGTSSRIENYLGFPAGVSGADLAQRAVAQAKKFGAEILTAQEAVSFRREDPYRYIKLSDGNEIACYSIVFATGMLVRKLDAIGIEALQGIGVYYGAAMTEASTYKDKNICIVGGANSAGQGAVFFSRYAKNITMLIRSGSLSPGMSNYLVERINSTPNINVISEVEVISVSGNNKLEKVVVKNIKTAQETIHEFAAMFIFIGAKPHAEMLAGFVPLDEKGFILTGSDLPKINNRTKGWNLERDPFLFETNIPGVFAVGDVRSGANRRVAAAVGEGSAGIYMVQKYLQTV
ncbi:MAG: FAD-dependent oxidoreductase [Bacteroidota bacterium]|nr:FAD-dependent oxidoreductase [Bacteroidota bacterium]